MEPRGVGAGRTTLLTIAWVGSTCSYYGVTLWQLDFGGGLYLQNALGASLELPAYSSATVCYDRLLYAITHCVQIDIDTTTAARICICICICENRDAAFNDDED